MKLCYLHMVGWFQIFQEVFSFLNNMNEFESVGSIGQRNASEKYSMPFSKESEQESFQNTY